MNAGEVDEPFFVADGIYIGNAVHAASWHVLRELDISLVVNAGVPRCVSHFAGSDDRITYCNVEVYDNASPNLVAIFCASLWPVLRESVEAGRSVLVHCHSGLSKSPAVVVAFLLMRYPALDLLGALHAVVKAARGGVKISDHMLGELLLLSDARSGSGSDLASSRNWSDPPVCDERLVPLPDEAAVAASLAEASWSDLAAVAAARGRRGALLARRAVLARPAAPFRDVDECCRLLDALAPLPDHLLACVRRDPSSTVGPALADSLHANVAQFAPVLRCVAFFRCFDAFGARFWLLSRRRFLSFFAGGREECPPEEEDLTAALAQVPQLRRLERRLVRLRDDLQRCVRSLSGGRLLLVEGRLWDETEDTAEDAPRCNVPESLAALGLPAAEEGRRIALQTHLGSVNVRYGDVTLVMPPDVFCVLDVFNQSDGAVSRDELFDVCRADRLDRILEYLARPLPRTQTPLVLKQPDGLFAINPAFTSRVKKLELRID